MTLIQSNVANYSFTKGCFPITTVPGIVHIMCVKNLLRVVICWSTYFEVCWVKNMFLLFVSHCCSMMTKKLFIYPRQLSCGVLLLHYIVFLPVGCKLQIWQKLKSKLPSLCFLITAHICVGCEPAPDPEPGSLCSWVTWKSRALYYQHRLIANVFLEPRITRFTSVRKYYAFWQSVKGLCGEVVLKKA